MAHVTVLLHTTKKIRGFFRFAYFCSEIENQKEFWQNIAKRKCVSQHLVTHLIWFTNSYHFHQSTAICYTTFLSYSNSFFRPFQTSCQLCVMHIL